MCAWTVLVIAATKSVFLSWELLQCFSIFKLGSSKGTVADRHKKMSRLAQKFDMDMPSLQREFFAVEPFASAKKSEDVSWNKVAWRRGRDKHGGNLRTLRSLLARLGAFSG